MGVVIAAQHLQLDEPVAIKFLLPEVMTDAVSVARFLREARASIKIKSEHVVRIMDVGTLETGEPFMVMEYLQGSDLAAVLTQSGPLPAQHACDFVVQACEALADAHALGIVHRDLKPSNLFLSSRNDGSSIVKILDFGISKVTAGSAAEGAVNMTRTATMMGTPLYMSPEQMSSARDADMRSDIWSMGAILYELLAGAPPFNGKSLPELCLRILQHEPAPLGSVRQDVPRALEAVVRRCLQKDAASRFQNVGELATALAEFCSRDTRPIVQRISRVMSAAGFAGAGPALPRAEAPAGPPDARTTPGASTAAAWGRTASGRRGGKTLAVSLAVLVLGMLAVTGVVVLRAPRHASERATPALPPQLSDLAQQAPLPSAPQPSADAAPDAAAPSPVTTRATRASRGAGTASASPPEPVKQGTEPAVQPPAPAVVRDPFSDNH
jgi:serine/threonine-protein kinase